MSRRNHWYGRSQAGKQVRILQSRTSETIQSLPEPIVRAAAAEYNRQGYDQSYERLQERGGLSLVEIVTLLADALGIEGPS